MVDQTIVRAGGDSNLSDGSRTRFSRQAFVRPGVR